MEIEENDFKFLLNTKNYTASIIKTPDFNESVFIPRFIQYNNRKYKIISIEKDAFHEKELKSVTFPKDSEITIFKDDAFHAATIKKLQIPASLRTIEEGCFFQTEELSKIEISPKNIFFKYVNDEILVWKSDEKLDNFDVLLYARFDLKDALIPRYIKRIANYAFSRCKELNSLNFEDDSSLESIGTDAFSWTQISSKIILPPSVKTISSSFTGMKKLEYIEIQGKNVEIEYSCFHCSSNLKLISFPNAKIIHFRGPLPDITKVEIRREAKLTGEVADKYKDRIQYIDENISIPTSKFGVIKKYIQIIEKKLQKYQKIKPFNFEAFEYDKIIEDEDENENENDSTLSGSDIKEQKEEDIFFSDEDEKHQEVIKKIGEGESWIAYKVFDKRDSRLFCKKVLKSDDNQITFQNVKNFCKEFEVLHYLMHPCICKSISINTQERVKEEETETKTKDDENKEYPTTIAILLEYESYKLNECLKQHILNNTLKVRIAVDVAFAMSYLHSNGIIHRNLNTDNIMLNELFETKIIGFDLSYVSELNLSQSNVSLTKKIGELDFMSPEMQNEEDYDEKTDVYSYGVVLHVIFTGELPKQKLKDRIKKVPPSLPNPSSSISKCCIDLIRKCMEYEAKDRPSFDKILEILKENSFNLASEVDFHVILHRYQELKNFNSSQKNRKD